MAAAAPCRDGAAVIALAVVVAVAVAVAFAIHAIRVTGFCLPRWPERTPRPFECLACRVSYTDARQLGWHNLYHHPDTYQVTTSPECETKDQ